MKNINSQQLDLLKELGNIGMGNATSSLSAMLKEERVNMFVPEVSVVPLSELPDCMGGPEKQVTGIYVKVGGDIGLYMIFIVPLDSAENLAFTVTEGMAEGLDEFGLSAVAEVGNILTAGYLNALSFLMDMTLVPEPPGVAVDMTEAILGTILAESQVVEDFIVLIKTSFVTEKTNIQGFLTIIPEKDAFEVIYNMLLKGA
ncbi:chemotaxis protein CheC [Candidatus Contubernalis alkaliaceticus]|uniref:chemotaxis protein CheC n=1 Tax=Candidatus Contubernalis alkaliaceticus TaxID=338645 RepID=UPI001F4BE992|nr:chemotaxis protein CheC [Candidatus Contubernalis alkalaceticus]UNC91778.1 chemotaxis protein CheC [Candidatus Contubernalis alkalaceticus]